MEETIAEVVVMAVEDVLEEGVVGILMDLFVFFITTIVALIFVVVMHENGKNSGFYDSGVAGARGLC